MNWQDANSQIEIIWFSKLNLLPMVTSKSLTDINTHII